ncbi:hypothetical protein QH639_12230 [Lysinibacillus sp. 1 U-2021]|uniref:hypothetical protein n=1 Tax=Lysinibacillus sp. 1 U-2021 TaxID=3039426 RepID=UPI00247FB488|nr:hypothetical protein [Lysinibacillus sp. 1 U-2021]WGT41509.1 hypothetical protein QH639_12230 [Lysinibacillus sp. 1 U-2021]
MIMHVYQASSKTTTQVFGMEPYNNLYALKPVFDAITEYARLHNKGGFHAFIPDTKEGIAESRNFCSLYGIDVEAATGLSNGAFTCYFLNINVFNQEYIFRKATFILNMPFSI